MAIELHRSEAIGDPHAFRFGAQDYLLRGPGGRMVPARFDWDDGWIRDLDLLRRPGEASGETAQRVGDRLRAFLRQGDFAAQEATIEAALREERRVVVTVRSSAAELYALPWELVALGEGGRHLGADPNALVRYEWWPETSSVPEAPSPRPEGGRLLVAWSAAAGRVPASDHVDALASAAALGHVPFDAGQDVVPHASAKALAAALRSEPPAVLHILCHGVHRGDVIGLGFDPAEPGDPPDVVDGARLRELLAPHAGALRLVVLSACETGSASAPSAHLGSVAQALHRAGIRAVIASRFPLGVDASTVLSDALYHELLGGPSSVEAAFVRARARLQAEFPGLDWASLQLYARAADGDDCRPVVVRPYRGLLPFRDEHARFFLGRELERMDLTRRLSDAADGLCPRFQVVAGASGSGKSSLVMAGVLPELLDGDPTWDLRRMRPSDPGGPHRALYAALHKLRLERRSAAGMAPVPGEIQRAHVLEEARLLRTEQPGRKLLVLVDQFEELFTHAESSAATGAFVRTLWALTGWAELDVVVLVTLRVDFVGPCGDVIVDETGRRLDTVIYDPAHTTFVAQVPIDRLPHIIGTPARMVGLEFEGDLIDRIVQEVGEDSAALPLVQYALDELWLHRTGSLLTQAAYADLGGFRGALTRSADTLLDGMDPLEQAQVRRLLVRLVGSSERGAVETRRRVALAPLRPEDDAAAGAFDRAVQALVGARLLVTGGDDGAGAWVEIAHEALIRGWRRLHAWLEEDKEMLRQLAVVRAAYRGWRDRGDDEDEAEYLLVGGRLAQVEDIRAQHGAELDVGERAFIDRSRVAADRATVIFRRNVRVAGLFGVLLLILFAGLWWSARLSKLDAEESAELAKSARADAEAESERAKAQTRRAEAEQRRAEVALAEAKEQRAEAERNRVEADSQRAEAEEQRTRAEAQARATAEARDALQGALTQVSEALALQSAEKAMNLSLLPGRANEALAAALQAVGARTDGAPPRPEATAALLGVLRAVRGRTLEGSGAPVVVARHDPLGSRVAVATADGRVRLWEPRGGAEVELSPSLASSPQVLVWSGDGRFLVAGGSLGSVVAWDLAGQEVRAGLTLRQARTRGEAVTAAGFLPGSALLVAGFSRGRLEFRDVAARSRLERVPGVAAPLTGGGAIRAVAFSPSGPAVFATGSEDGRVVLYPRGGGEPRTLDAGAAWIRDMVFTEDGETLVVGRSDGGLRAHTLGETPGAFTFAGHGGAVESITARGGRILTAGRDGVARLWEVGSEPPVITLRGHGDWVRSAALSEDGARIVTAGEEGTVRLWDAEGNAIAVLVGHGGAVAGARFVPGGRRVLSWSRDGTVRLWEPDAGDAVGLLPAHASRVRWSAAGDRLLTFGGRTDPTIWNPATGEPVHRIRARGDRALVLAGDFVGGANASLLYDDGVRVHVDAGAGSHAVHRPSSGLDLVGADTSSRGVGAGVTADGALWTWTVDGTTQRPLEHPAGHSWASARWLPGPVDRLLAGDGLGGVFVWTVEGEAATSRSLDVAAAGEPARALGFDLSGRWAVAAFGPRAVRVDLESGDATAVHRSGAADAITSVAATGAGDLLLGLRSGATERWTLDGEPVLAALLAGGEAEVTAVRPSTNDARALVLDRAGVARVFDVASGRLVSRFGDALDPVLGAELSPDGRSVITAQSAGTAIVHPLEADEAVRIACEWLQGRPERLRVASVCDPVPVEDAG